MSELENIEVFKDGDVFATVTDPPYAQPRKLSIWRVAADGIPVELATAYLVETDK